MAIDAFIESPRFPEELSFDSVFSLAFNTSVISLSGGNTVRNINWQTPLRTVDASFNMTTRAILNSVVSFFYLARGRACGFRVKDHSDYKSCEPEDEISNTDQLIGVGDNSETEFQLIKVYGSGNNSFTRTINKPVNGTVVVALDGGNQEEGWEVDYTTGILTFYDAPNEGLEITVGFEFDVPMAFAADTLSTSLETYAAGQARIPLEEIRL